MRNDGNKFNVLFMGSSKNVGLTFNLTRLAIALKKIGSEIIVVAEPKEEEKGLFRELKRNQMKYHTVCGLDKLSVKNTIIAARTIGEIIDQNNVNVIHTQGIRHLIVAFLGLKLFSRRRDTAIVTTIHSTFAGTRGENLILLVESFWLNICADLVIAVADTVAAKLLNIGVFKNKIATIHNGVDLDMLDRSMRTRGNSALVPCDLKSSSCIVLGYFARLDSRKGHKYLIEALAQDSKEFPNIKLLIAGDGPLSNELKKQSRNLGMEKKVLFVGQVDHKRVFQFLNMIDIYVFPSLAELFPFAILEAMAAGKPIVATNVGGVSEAVMDGVNGYLVPPRDPTSLANAILRLVKEPDKAAEMGARGRKMVEEKFSIDVVTRKLNDVYEMALKRKISV